MKNNNYILEAANLKKTYHNGPIAVEVLKDISLQIFHGEIIVIMGASGVGKSTLLNLIGTLDRPTAGNLLINKQDVLKFKERKLAQFRNRHIGFIFQFHHLLAEFTALENVVMPRMITGNGWKNEEERAKQLLEDVGLGHRLSHRPNQLSGGEQQRVAIARALMNQPKLILADEPTGDLDRHNSEVLFDLITRLNQKYRQSFVIVTHDEMFMEQAHRIIYLADGNIEEERILKNVVEE